ncbi:13113_t:CDS:2 [Funneliformis geosporum]|uniref:11757_t:CDS:1 n=1 Tax=Funneliformis geosporum TaxID=1117311 RepID=A0A9W4SUP1_9GLOM|nr:13113_t:CDS:2 [Funneliformis geosporum]CAI2179738.1 11757_t:CDS:2 [Funneliformis geosporum]
MDKVIEIPTLPKVSPTSTFGEEVGGSDTVERPKNDSDYYEFYEQLDRIVQRDEEVIENFSKTLKSIKIGEELDLKAVDNSKTNFDPVSKFDITEEDIIRGSSREEYLQIVGECSLMDDDDIFIEIELPKIKKTRHRKIDKDIGLKNKQLILQRKLQQLSNEHQMREEKLEQQNLYEQKERLETITYFKKSDPKENSSQTKIRSSKKEKTDPTMASLPKEYKGLKRQLGYMKTYARKAEDERDEAKKALVKVQQDIAQMNDQFENLRASVQIHYQRTTQTPNIIFPTRSISSSSLEFSAKRFLSDPLDINGSENINMFPQENIKYFE